MKKLLILALVMISATALAQNIPGHSTPQQRIADDERMRAQAQDEYDISQRMEQEQKLQTQLLQKQLEVETQVLEMQKKQLDAQSLQNKK